MHLNKEIKRTFVTRILDTLQSMFAPPHLVFGNKGAAHLQSSHASTSLATSRRKGGVTNIPHRTSHHTSQVATSPRRGVATCRVFTVTPYAEKRFVTPRSTY